ncbi:hypothetical protein ACI2OX_09725 [Bacillus sp. N9]
MTGLRLLYEHVEQQLMLGTEGSVTRTVRMVDYELSLKRNGDGTWKACMIYEGKQKCME